MRCGLAVARNIGEVDVFLGESYNDELLEKEWKNDCAVQVGRLWAKFIFIPRQRPATAS
jgi:hypothetical protein